MTATAFISVGPTIALFCPVLACEPRVAMSGPETYRHLTDVHGWTTEEVGAYLKYLSLDWNALMAMPGANHMADPAS